MRPAGAGRPPTTDRTKKRQATERQRAAPCVLAYKGNVFPCGRPQSKKNPLRGTKSAASRLRREAAEPLLLTYLSNVCDADTVHGLREMWTPGRSHNRRKGAVTEVPTRLRSPDSPDSPRNGARPTASLLKLPMPQGLRGQKNFVFLKLIIFLNSSLGENISQFCTGRQLRGQSRATATLRAPARLLGLPKKR